MPFVAPNTPETTALPRAPTLTLPLPLTARIPSPLWPETNSSEFVERTVTEPPEAAWA